MSTERTRLTEELIMKSMVVHATYGDNRATPFEVVLLGLSEDRKMAKLAFKIRSSEDLSLIEQTRWEPVDKWLVDSILN